MKKYLLVGLLMGICLCSCSKDTEEEVMPLLGIEEISGVWYFEEEYTPENTKNHGEPFHIHDVSTRSEGEQVNMLYQTIEIGHDGSFVWHKKYYYPYRWLNDKETWGEETTVYEMKGKIERTENSLSFFSINSTDIGFIGRVFNYELSADHQLLILHPGGVNATQNLFPYSLHFYKK